MREITLVRLRALLSQARGDDVAYPDLVSRFRAMAKSVGYEGHTDWAEAMTLRRSGRRPPEPWKQVSHGIAP